ncbi:MAG: S41 family peptidase [Pseudomonadota bacterium]
MLETLFIAMTLPSSLCANEVQTLTAAAERIEAAYVLEETAGRVASNLRSLAENTPKRSRCRSREEFARALTKTLRAVSGDGHFYIEETAEKNDDWIASWRAGGYKRGQGITHVEVLEGNIGYIRIKSFYELEQAFPHYRAAFDMVADTNALILDLRDNHGGSPQTAWPVQWTFLERGSPSPTKIDSRRDGHVPREEPPVLWQRYGIEKPLVIVTNGDTFSAPEAVAYTLQSEGRAAVFGERSGGGAHMLDDGKDLGTGFTLYTPTTRPISVTTGQNWEGKGVVPDVQVSNSDAVDAATEHLRERLSALQIQ